MLAGIESTDCDVMRRSDTLSRMTRRISVSVCGFACPTSVWRGRKDLDNAGINSYSDTNYAKNQLLQVKKNDIV